MQMILHCLVNSETQQANESESICKCQIVIIVMIIKHVLISDGVDKLARQSEIVTGEGASFA